MGKRRTKAASKKKSSTKVASITKLGDRKASLPLSEPVPKVPGGGKKGGKQKKG